LPVFYLVFVGQVCGLFLLVAQGFNGVLAGGLTGGVEAEDDTNNDSHTNAEGYSAQRQG